jgi:hypothetical protein
MNIITTNIVAANVTILFSYPRLRGKTDKYYSNCDEDAQAKCTCKHKFKKIEV